MPSSPVFQGIFAVFLILLYPCVDLLIANLMLLSNLGVVEMLRSNPDYKGLMLTISEALEKANKDTLLISVDNHKDSLAISRSVT